MRGGRVRTGMERWVQNHPVTAFPAVYLGWAFLFWLPVLRSETSVWAMPNLAWFLAGGASPLLAGLSLAFLSGGGARLRDLLTRLVDWRLIPGSWWLPLFLFWLLFDLGMTGIAMLAGISEAPLDPHWSLVRNPQALLFLLLLSFVFPAVEEIGLRGYYLEALETRLPPAFASLVNGAVWAAWHAPFVAFTGYYANTSFQPALAWWLPMIVCHTVLIAVVYRQTNRSILAVLLFHGLMNFTGEWLRISSDMYPFMLTGTALTAACALWWLHRTRGATGS